MDPVLIRTAPSSLILGAVVKKQSRRSVQLALDPSSRLEGRVSLTWKILGHNDGGVIQITYLGDFSVNVDVVGTIVGQRPIGRYTNEVGFKTAQAVYDEERAVNIRRRRYSPFFMIGGAFGLVIAFVASMRSDVHRSRMALRLVAALAAVWVILFYIMYLASEYPTLPTGL